MCLNLLLEKLILDRLLHFWFFARAANLGPRFWQFW